MPTTTTTTMPSASARMMLRLNSADRLDMVTDGAVRLIRELGPEGLTIRRMAAASDMSPGWLMDRFGSKDRLLSLMAATLGARWWTWVDRRAHRDGLLALLPTEDGEVEGVQVWLTFVELGRLHDGVGERTAVVRRDERALVAALLRQGPEHYPSADEVTAILALVDGLRQALCAAQEAIAADDARRILHLHLPQLSQLPQLGQ